MQGLENAIAEDRILRQEAGLESEPGEEWQTESDEESALNKPTGPELFGPPTGEMSPLSDAADEIILSIIQHLTPPLYLEPDLPKDISSLLNLSCTCTRLRRIVKPALFKRVVLFAPADKDGKLHAPAVPRIRSYCQLLLHSNVSRYIRALWIDVPGSHSLPASMLSDWIDRVARAALPLTSVLVLRNLHATPVFLEALAGARKLRILDVHDGFVGNSQLATQLRTHTLALKEVNVYYCSVSTDDESSAVPFELLKGMHYVERLVVRAFKDRFPAGFFPQGLWSHLRILALDSGNAYNSGLISLFQEFEAIRKTQHCPLAELSLEIRDPIPGEFQSIVACFKGHQPLKKLNLMILPDISPSLIADLAALLPQLEEINLVALRSSTVLWPHGEPWQYAEAIAAWPNLKVFGLNGTPTSSQQRPQRVDAMKSWKTLIEKSQSIQKLNIWHSFGDTNYYGREFSVVHFEFRESEGGKVVERHLHDDCWSVVFFPLRETVIVPQEPDETALL